METWLNDNIPVPGEVYRQFVKDLYQRNLLVRGETAGRRQAVDLKRITCPVLNLMATQDDLVPPSQSEPFNDLVGSSDRTMLKIASRAHWLGRRSEGPTGALAGGVRVVGRPVVSGLIRPVVSVRFGRMGKLSWIFARLFFENV